MTLDAAPAIDYDTCHGTLTIDGVEMVENPAWSMLDLSALLWSPEQRGTDLPLPRGTILPRPRRLDTTVLPFPFVVVGSVDLDGDAYADPYVGLQTNLAYLMSNVLEPTLVGDGTRTAVWTTPSGATVTAEVHVRPWRPRARPGAVLVGVLELSDTEGLLHL